MNNKTRRFTVDIPMSDWIKIEKILDKKRETDPFVNLSKVIREIIKNALAHI